MGTADKWIQVRDDLGHDPEPERPWVAMKVTMGEASHVGHVRSLNEDSCLADGNIAVVADGMGGHACGDVASRLTIEALRPLARRPSLTAAEVEDAIVAANEAILAEVRANPASAGMGTTVTGLALIQHFGNPHWLAFNVGDSRVYRVDGSATTQITKDHSEVAELVEAGRITAAEALTHPLRHVVTRSLGTSPMPDIDMWIFPPHRGDEFVICSDGLTNEVADVEIREISTRSGSAAQAAQDLVAAALEHGARDNVTTVVVRVADQHVEDDALVNTTPRKSLLEGTS